MIRVLGTKYKSIGNILVIPASDEAPFYVRSPVDFTVEEKDKVYHMVMRYTNYNDTFDILSCKMVVPLGTYDQRVCLLHMHNYLTPDPNHKEYGSGYVLSWIVGYNKDKGENDDLYKLYISEPLCLTKLQQEQKN